MLLYTFCFHTHCHKGDNEQDSLEYDSEYQEQTVRHTVQKLSLRQSEAIKIYEGPRPDADATNVPNSLLFQNSPVVYPSDT